MIIVITTVNYMAELYSKWNDLSIQEVFESILLLCL